MTLCGFERNVRIRLPSSDEFARAGTSVEVMNIPPSEKAPYNNSVKKSAPAERLAGIPWALMWPHFNFC